VLFLRSLPVLVLVFASTSLADGVDAGGIFHIKPVQPMGTTSVPDLTDVTWDGDKPCVAQGTPEQHVRCWDPATKRWGAKAALPAGAQSGHVVSGLPVQVGSRSIRLSLWGPSSSNKSNTCTVLAGETVLQRFRVEDGDRGKTFVPSALSISPSGTTGVALVSSYTTGVDRFADGRVSVAVEHHGFRLWFFSLTAP